ncbi:hypothetical protein ABT369_05410 [Dactylosporangium sp. NPDC000244]|uniref:hypothetical protein n=1 Tax=Dactylosporangium sp. NPDC000244 TaxID=3154365 RepID=UPI00331BF2DF
MNRNPEQARAEFQRRSAERAAQDPIKLARAARIVRAALAAGHLTAADLQSIGASSRHTFATSAR